MKVEDLKLGAVYWHKYKGSVKYIGYTEEEFVFQCTSTGLRLWLSDTEVYLMIYDE